MKHSVPTGRRSELATQGRALAAARESLRLTQNQYEAGLIDYLSVVQVETTALSTERAALSLASDRLAASVQLIAALGGGWEAATLPRSEEHTSELQSLMRISYAVFCLTQNT